MNRSKSTLSTNRQMLLQAMQRNPFSNIETVVQEGEPCFTPAPRITREIRLGVETPTRSVADDSDFGLKRVVTDLFDQFDQLRDATLVTIEVRHGLPARLILAGRV